MHASKLQTHCAPARAERNPDGTVGEQRVDEAVGEERNRVDASESRVQAVARRRRFARVARCGLAVGDRAVGAHRRDHSSDIVDLLRR